MNVYCTYRREFRLPFGYRHRPPIVPVHGLIQRDEDSASSLFVENDACSRVKLLEVGNVVAGLSKSLNNYNFFFLCTAISLSFHSEGRQSRLASQVIMVLSMLVALTSAPALLGTQEAIRQSQQKERREEHRARRCNLVATCIKSSLRAREINGRPLVLRDGKVSRLRQVIETFFDKCC